MAENALSPAFVKINYHSLWGTHVQTVPSVPYIPNVDPATGGQFDLRGAALPTDAEDAIIEFCELQSVFHTTDTVFDSFTIFAQADEESPAIPQYQAQLNIPGTITDPGWAKAVQYTFTFRTTAFGLFKLVMLDADSGNNFDVQIAPSEAAYTNLINYVKDPVSWVSGRDDERPSTFLQVSKTLNEALRKAYRMV